MITMHCHPSSMAEHTLRKREVEGSSPSGGSLDMLANIDVGGHLFL